MSKKKKRPDSKANSKAIQRKSSAVQQSTTQQLTRPATASTSYSLPSSIKWLTLALFVIISLIIYGRTLSYNYVLDDKLVYTENRFVTEGTSGISKILSTDSFTGYFEEENTTLVQGARYRPLSLISFNIEHTIFGLSEAVSHLINILLYGLTCWLIFICLFRLLHEQTNKVKSPWLSLALAATLLYLVHPLHVEAVANVKGRDEILSLLFSILALWTALKYVDTHSTLAKTKLVYLLGMVSTFFLGLLAKENTLTFLAIIPFGLYLFRTKHRFNKDLVIVFSLLLVTSLAYLFLRYSVIGFLINEAPSIDIMNNSFAGMTGSEKYATIGYTLLHYLKLNLVPYPLTHDYYPYHIPISNFGDWQVILSIVLHVLLVGLMFYSWKKNKVVAFSIGFYFATMSIVSNLVISIGTFMNERFAFAASLGTCLLLAHLILNTKKIAHVSVLSKVMLGLIVLIYATLSFLRVPAWESELALNTAAIKVSKNSARSNSFMATALFQQYKKAESRDEKMALLNRAQPYARKAVQIHPPYYNGNLMRAGIAGEKHKMDGNLDELLSEFKEIMMERPDVGFVTQYLDYIGSRVDQSKLLTFYKQSVNKMMDEQQRYDWAVKYLNLAVAIDQNDPELRSLMRKAYTGLGQLDKAKQYQ